MRDVDDDSVAARGLADEALNARFSRSKSSGLCLAPTYRSVVVSFEWPR
jgi:hypothetical protein